MHDFKKLYTDYLNETDKAQKAQQGFDMIVIYNNSEQWEKVIEIGTEAGEIAKEIAHKKQVTDIYRYLGVAYLNLKDWDKAKETLLFLLSVATIPEDLNLIATFKWKLAECERHLTSFRQALPLYLETIRFYEEHDLKRQIVIITANIGIYYFEDDDYEEGEKYFQKALQTTLEINDLDNYAAVSNIIAIRYQELGKVQSAIEYCENALKVAEGQMDYIEKVRLHNTLATCHHSIHNLQIAIDHYHIALELAKKHRITDMYDALYENIGTLYKDLNMPDKALEYYKKAIKVLKPRISPALLSNIALVYKDIGNIAMSLNYRNKSLKTYIEHKDRFGIATSYVELGSIYLEEKGQYKKAKTYFENAMKTLKKEKKHPGIYDDSRHSDAYAFEHLCRRFANLYVSIKEYKNAGILYKTLLQRIDDIENKELVMVIYDEYRIFLATIGKISESLKYLQKSIELKTSLKDDKQEATGKLNYFSFE